LFKLKQVLVHLNKFIHSIHRPILLATLAFLSIEDAYCQHHEEAEAGLLHSFSKGILSGQVRNFSMATINNDELTDYFANAIGASIHYETLPFKGFQIGLNGIFVYKTFSNNLLHIDSIAQQRSRYELQLFDIEHPGNYNDLDRLEELYLKYQYKDFSITYGKMELESPLVRLHDGRMKPKVFSGIKADYSHHQHHFTTAWFNKASPRSTTHWYTIDEAIGLYNNGVTLEGEPSDYHKNLTSRGLGVAGYQSNPKPGLHLNLWTYFLENISNSTTAMAVWEQDAGLYGGVSYLHQIPLNLEEHTNLAAIFHHPEEQTHMLSTRIGYAFDVFETHLNATHIFNTGRYLFPREFGVDPSFTYISRSQLEGLGNATSIGIGAHKAIKQVEINLDWNYTHTDSDPRFNKYQLPSYNQFNVDCSYRFHDKLEGLHLRLLYVNRIATDKTLTLQEQFNTVNFNQINLIANFSFSSSEHHGHFH
jgi:hypothetical protein